MSLTMPLTIHKPRWIVPALLQIGDSLEIIVRGDGSDVLLDSLPDSASVVLARPDRSKGPFTLQVIKKTAIHHDEQTAIKIECLCEDPVALGLFDLKLIQGRQTLGVADQAVSIQARIPDSFDVVHITDTHFLQSNPEGDTLVDRADYLKGLVVQINAIKPVFVIHTGDLISRYGLAPENRLTDDQIVWQYQNACPILKKLDVPLFITPGNHDLAFPSSRQCWADQMGMPWAHEADDFYWDYGQFRFVCMDTSVQFDRSGGQLPQAALTEERLAWFEHTCRHRPDHAGCVLLTHGDYDANLKLFNSFARSRVDLALCGHSRVSPWTHCDMSGTIDGHLSRRLAWRRITFDHRNITFTDGPKTV